VPAFVPALYVEPIARAASRWNVSAALLAAQLYAESNFDPFAESRTRARGIAQFMPGTPRSPQARPLHCSATNGAKARLSETRTHQGAHACWLEHYPVR
jgi:hypothetical protein